MKDRALRRNPDSTSVALLRLTSCLAPGLLTPPVLLAGAHRLRPSVVERSCLLKLKRFFKAVMRLAG